MSSTQRTIEAVWRIESPRLIAGLTRIVRDVAVAEELAQEAFLAALKQWPAEGVPQSPGAWLMTTARRRAVDYVRRRRADERYRHERAWVEREGAGEIEEAIDARLDDDIGDDLLRLVFMTCHPALPAESRAALTLRLLAGLTTDEIARAFLTTEATIAQRIVRAKRTLAEKQVAFEAPRGEALAERLASVLEVVYLIFNEGYTATGGGDWMRPGLCEEALRLGRILAGLAPAEPEVHGLVALMETQSSRTRARTGPDGAPILLLDQNRALWDQLLIRRGLAALEEAQRLTSKPGPYVLQAEIAACHARAVAASETDWGRIASLYERLYERVPSPVIELNRAVAVGMASGPAAGLEVVERLRDDRTLRNYHLLPGVRGDFLEKLGRDEEAAREFERAASMTQNARERELLSARAQRARDRAKT